MGGGEVFSFQCSVFSEEGELGGRTLSGAGFWLGAVELAESL